MKTDKQFVNTLEDNIREQGAPSKLVSDRAQVKISNKVLDIAPDGFLQQWDRHEGENQVFRFEDTADGYYRIRRYRSNQGRRGKHDRQARHHRHPETPR